MSLFNDEDNVEDSDAKDSNRSVSVLLSSDAASPVLSAELSAAAPLLSTVNQLSVDQLKSLISVTIKKEMDHYHKPKHPV